MRVVLITASQKLQAIWDFSCTTTVYSFQRIVQKANQIHLAAVLWEQLNEIKGDWPKKFTTDRTLKRNGSQQVEL